MWVPQLCRCLLVFLTEICSLESGVLYTFMTILYLVTVSISSLTVGNFSIAVGIIGIVSLG